MSLLATICLLYIPLHKTLYLSHTPTKSEIGIIIDSILKYYLHTLSISQSVDYTLHKLRVIQPYINLKTVQLHTTTLILSRLDLYYSVFHLTPFSLNKNFKNSRMMKNLKNSTDSPLLHE